MGEIILVTIVRAPNWETADEKKVPNSAREVEGEGKGKRSDLNGFKKMFLKLPGADVESGKQYSGENFF